MKLLLLALALLVFPVAANAQATLTLDAQGFDGYRNITVYHATVPGALRGHVHYALVGPHGFHRSTDVRLKDGAVPNDYVWARLKPGHYTLSAQYIDRLMDYNPYPVGDSTVVTLRFTIKAWRNT